jgi:hypothetical protein
MTTFNLSINTPHLSGPLLCSATNQNARMLTFRGIVIPFVSYVEA